MWAEFTVTIYDRKLDDMGITSEKKSRASCEVDTIIRYIETFDGEDNIVTMLYFNDGDSMQVDESYEYIKKLVNSIQDDSCPDN